MNNRFHGLARTLGITMFVFCIPLSFGAQASEYPNDEIIDHKKAHGSLSKLSAEAQSLTTDKPELFAQRYLMALDYIDTLQPRSEEYLKQLQLQSHVLHTLLVHFQGSEPYSLLVKSALSRIASLSSKADTTDDIKPYGTSGGSSTASENGTYKNVVMELRPNRDCSIELGQAFHRYCSNGNQTITALITGGGSTHDRKIDAYLNTLDWSQFKTNKQVLAAIKESGLGYAELDTFTERYGDANLPAKVSTLSEQEQKLIASNPIYYLGQKLQDTNDSQKTLLEAKLRQWSDLKDMPVIMQPNQLKR